MSLKIHNHFKNEKSTTRIETHTGFDELLEYASLDSTYLFDDVLDELSKYYDYVDDAFDEEQATNDPEFIIKKEGGDERADYYTEDIFYVHLPSKEAAEELADILDGKLSAFISCCRFLPCFLICTVLFCSPGSASGKEPACPCRSHKRHGFNRWLGRIPWRRNWQLTPVFFPRKFCKQS